MQDKVQAVVTAQRPQNQQQLLDWHDPLLRYVFTKYRGGFTYVEQTVGKECGMGVVGRL